MSSSVLIVDDEKSILKALRMILEGKYYIHTAEKGADAKQIFQRERPDLVLLDIGLPDESGIEVLKAIKEAGPDTVVVMVTAIEEVKTVVEAIRLGAYDYLVKPINSQELLLTIKNALDNKKLKNRILRIQQPFINNYKFEFIGQNDKIKEIINTARKVAGSIDTPIFIVGESGSGKGVLARTIHYNSNETPGPFVTVNCGAIAKELVESELFGYVKGAFTGAVLDGKKGHFEASSGGTIFLDEIGAMPFSAQAKLLGVLEDRKFCKVGGNKEISVSSRIIAATNLNVEEAVEQGLFRNDLFFRLNVVYIKLPPLRERKDDIILLTKYFMTLYNNKFGKDFKNILPEAKKILIGYHWPGNVRELSNTMERILLIESGDMLQPEHLIKHLSLPENNGPRTGYNHTIDTLDYEEVTKSLIKKALEQTLGNVTEAALLLNMPVHKLRYRIKKFSLKY